MKVLLLGKQGQLGYALIQEAPKSVSLVALDRHALDLTYPHEIERILRQHQPDVIINAAAYTQVDQAEHDRARCYAINALAPSVLASEAKRLGALLVHYSTDYVFDGRQSTPYTPTDAPNPINYYGYSKWMGEQAVVQSGCDYLVLRTSWVYHPDYGHNFYRKIQQLAQKYTQLSVVNDQYGIANNAITLAQETWSLLSFPLIQLKVLSGIYHLTDTTDQLTTWYGFARRIVAQMPNGSCIQVCPISSRDYPQAAIRPRWSVLQRSLPNLNHG